VVADQIKSVAPIEMRRRLVRFRLRTRVRTAAHRVLPDVLVIGGQRCGTSSLYKYLGRHPNIVPSLRKEVDYLTFEYWRGEDWYRGHFPLTTRRALAARAGRAFVTFEATPDYLFDPRAPVRAKELLPEAKLIALLRNPAERAVSQYHHNRRLEHEPLDLLEALQAEGERLDGEMERLEADPRYRALPLRRYAYVGRGLYAEQLARWLEVYPREQLLVVRFDALIQQPVETLARIQEFIGVPGWQPPEFRNHSYTASGTSSYAPPSDEVYEFLARRFSEPNERLVEMLGEEYRWEASAVQ
jgi:hypothetical protein